MSLAQMFFLWFLPFGDNFKTASTRQNMPYDLEVRRANTCCLEDFTKENLKPNYGVVSNPQKLFIDDHLRAFIKSAAHYAKTK